MRRAAPCSARSTRSSWSGPKAARRAAWSGASGTARAPAGWRPRPGPGSFAARRGSRWWRTARPTSSSSSPVARPMWTCGARLHDRVLAGGGRLAGEIARSPCLGHAALDLPARPGVPARTARLAIRFGRLELEPPRESRKAGAGPVAMTYVDLREETPPESATRRGPGALAAADHARGRDGGGRARHRRALRQALEDRGALPRHEAQGLRHRGAAHRRGDAAQPPDPRLPRRRHRRAADDGRARRRAPPGGSSGLSPTPSIPGTGRCIEAVSRSLEGRTERQKNPHPPGSLAFATWVCARLGGWTGYYGKPGPIVILSGWTEFQSLKQGAHLAHQIGNDEARDV